MTKRQCVPGLLAVLWAALLLSGCASEPAETAVPLRAKPWADAGLAGSDVRTPHYRILTTVRDAAVIERFARVMEAAYVQYAALVSPRPQLDRPLEVYFFATPSEWDAYTQRLTGPDAAVYLSVGPGGYAYGDRFVCWLFNESDLWGVAAHEGFHQYVARNLPLRLPPALEEGLATTFETVGVTDQHVTIDRRSNTRRRQGLAAAITAKGLIPLIDLIRLNAGDIAGKDLLLREGFYGQCWALARLMLESPQYADGLRRMLVDLRDGRAADVVGRTAEGTLYHPAAIRPLLEHYVTSQWSAFERAYSEAVRQSTAAENSPE
ncbi:MAG: hypothetical protein JWM57_4396 [Phycisphaerales bacterium]|nr:hypothetical protein [Phycisphaerales bacterium]